MEPIDPSRTSITQERGCVAPNAATLIDGLAASESVRDHELKDGRVRITYGDLPAVLERLDARAAAAAMTPDRPVALECAQSVAGAAAILHAMSRGYDVVLLPELGAPSKEAKTPRFIPSFCSHVVTTLADAAASEDESAIAHRWIEDQVRIETNPEFFAEPRVEAFEGPDLYLRTSGSTGTPKLTRMPHQKWLNNALACVERWGLTAEDRLAVPVPIFHSYGFGAAFLPGLLVGAAMDLQGGFNILRYLEREQEFNPNVAFLTPELCEMFVKVRRSKRTYKLAVSAGDKIRKETIASFEPRFGPLLNLYGSAEMGAVSSAAPEDPARQRLGTAGYALAGIELRVEETEEDLGEGRVGLLSCRQANGSNGYLFLEKGAWRYAPRGDEEWFPTGDLARIRDDGYLEILGRSGLSTKRDGLLVVFADVEQALERIPGVERAVVVAKGESRRGSRLVAVCVASGGEAPEAAAVRAHCFATLPHYAVPDEVRFVSSLPLLPSGKIHRRAVADLV